MYEEIEDEAKKVSETVAFGAPFSPTILLGIQREAKLS